MYAGNTSCDQWFAESWGMTVLTTLSSWVYFKLEGLSWGRGACSSTPGWGEEPQSPQPGLQLNPCFS